MTTNVDDVIRVAAEGSNSDAGQQYINIFHFRCGVINDSNDNTVSDEIRLGLDAVWANIASIISTKVGVFNYSLFNETQQFLYNDEPAVFVGTNVTEPISSQVAALVLGRTATARVQGRKYIGGLGEDQVASAGRLEASAITALKLWADAYIAQIIGLSTNEYDPGTYRPPTIVPPAPELFTPFTSRKVMVTTRTQRRRTQTAVLA